MLKRAAVTAVLFALPLFAAAQSSDQLVDRYTDWAGSKQNATSLVTGLRDGKEVKLTSGTTTETFTPKTDKMGNGNVDNALALAQESLRQKGITDPTPAQIEAALNGGTITVNGKPVELKGILVMRAQDKMGWGQIANSMGIKLGDVKRAEKADAQATNAARGNSKPEKPNRPERPERPEKPERPNK